MDDIVKRLRDAARRKWPGEPDQRHSFFGQAADESEALRERVVGGATALEVIADTAEWHRGDEGRTHLAVRVADNADLSCPAFRRAALRDAVIELLKGANG